MNSLDTFSSVYVFSRELLLIPLCTPPTYSVNSVHDCWFGIGDRLFCIDIC